MLFRYPNIKISTNPGSPKGFGELLSVISNKYFVNENHLYTARASNIWILGAIVAIAGLVLFTGVKTACSVMHMFGVIRQ